MVVFPLCVFIVIILVFLMFCRNQEIVNETSDEIELYLNEQLSQMFDCTQNIAQILDNGKVLLQIQELQKKFSHDEEYPYFDILCEIYETMNVNDENALVYKQTFDKSKENFNRAVKVYGTKVAFFPTINRWHKENEEKINV